MFRVVLATLPAMAGAIYFFGWRSLSVVAVSLAAGTFTEWLFCRARQEPVSSAVLVSAVLYALTLPPTVPYFFVVIGIVFGIFFGKEVYGGFGRNVFNPALVGRCFVYVSFPVAMTAKWVMPHRGWPGGLGAWTWPDLGVDTITRATPLYAYKQALAAKIPTHRCTFFLWSYHGTNNRALAVG